MIRAYEGQSVHNSIIDALVAQEIKRQNAAREREHAEALRRASEPGVMMRPAYEAYWALLIWRARRKYGRNPRYSKAARLLMGLYGLVILEIAETWRWLEAWNRSA